MAEREWTNDDLGNYLTMFPEEQREAVFKVILESDLLQRFLSTTEGRLILNSVVDKIRDNTMRIVRAAISPVDNVNEMKAAALQINVAYDFMLAIANTAIDGEKHKETVQNISKRGKRIA